MLDAHLTHDIDLTEIPGGYEYFCRDCGYYFRYTENGQEMSLYVSFGDDPRPPETIVDRYLEPYRKAFGERL